MKNKKAKSKIFHYNFFSKSRKAAMEMSVGTIVTIVLLMTVLVLGIFFIQKIFFTGTNAIDEVGTEIESQIQKLFSEEGERIAIYPSSRDITVKKGDDPKGFAFNVRNKDVESAKFNYEVRAEDISKCGSTMTLAKANGFLLGGSGSFSLSSGESLAKSRLVRFIIPETAPICTMIYVIEVEQDGTPYASADIVVKLK